MMNLKSLALSDTGFVFDPKTGNTYTLNDTALFAVKALRDGYSQEEVLKSMMEEFDVGEDELERDLTDLLIQLTEFGLWNQ